MFTQIKSDFANPGKAVSDGSFTDWFLVFGMLIVISAGWAFIIKHLKGATL